ncbi:MAG: CPBP family intramembrane glutamic endopeptidase [Pirellulales bacterium]
MAKTTQSASPHPIVRQWKAYWSETRRPLASLAFVLPLLLLYEGGVLLLGTAAVRNGADVWLRQLLDVLGLGSYFLLPILTVGVLLGWHHTTHEPWRLSASVLYGMLVESAALALLLLAVAHTQAHLISQLDAVGGVAAAASVRENVSGLIAAVVSYFGAGIYEEVLFRLLLLPTIAGAIAMLGGQPPLRTLAAVLLTSAAFAAAHYVGPHGETLSWYTFTFRFLAGGFFAMLFVYRGFGIAAGTHALYDVFVGV